MAFPQTRHSLIRRINDTASEQDWRQFLADYWEPVCSFAAKRGATSWHDAEDVASQTFEALLSNDLLRRWMDQPTAKLRTLLCRVTINVLSNRARVTRGRQRLLKELAQAGSSAGVINIGPAHEVSTEDADVFYGAWVTQVVQRTVDNLMLELHRQGKGDYFRVLYSRVCEAMTARQVGESLGLKLTSVENYFKAAKKRLSTELETSVRDHVDRYSDEADSEEEFRLEWSRLSEHLSRIGGLELAVKRAHEEGKLYNNSNRRSDAFLTTTKRLETRSETSPMEE